MLLWARQKRKERRRRHREIVRKLQWYLDTWRKVLALEKEIESHMRVLDFLL